MGVCEGEEQEGWPHAHHTRRCAALAALFVLLVSLLSLSQRHACVDEPTKPTVEHDPGAHGLPRPAGIEAPELRPRSAWGAEREHTQTPRIDKGAGTTRRLSLPAPHHARPLRRRATHRPELDAILNTFRRRVIGSHTRFPPPFLFFFRQALASAAARPPQARTTPSPGRPPHRARRRRAPSWPPP